ncbi:hypothetical protein [Kitasatospora sp. NPDC093102]|uniref:hypothetical protein n=1 Tax=Kitasatospora sp. NPDC093102 TaxID=3155069 RepID=UPI003448B0BB
MPSPSTWSGAAEAEEALGRLAPPAGPRPALGVAPAALAGAGRSGITLWARGGTGAFTSGLFCRLPLAAVRGVQGALPAGRDPMVTAVEPLLLGAVPTLFAFHWLLHRPDHRARHGGRGAAPAGARDGGGDRRAGPRRAADGGPAGGLGAAARGRRGAGA